jgi:predicted dehydrogenase
LQKKGLNMSKIVFGIVGVGWRADFYLRIARELPDTFEVCGVVARKDCKGKEIEKAWGVKTFRTIEDLLSQTNPSFVVVSVPVEAAPAAIEELSQKGAAVLTETPPASDLWGLIDLNRLMESGAKIQVAEQYHLQPLHAARISIANSRKLGRISQVQLSVCHGYHSMSLMRKLLGIQFENAQISAYKFISPIVEGPERNGAPKAERMKEVEAKAEENSWVFQPLI